MKNMTMVAILLIPMMSCCGGKEVPPEAPKTEMEEVEEVEPAEDEIVAPLSAPEGEPHTTEGLTAPGDEAEKDLSGATLGEAGGTINPVSLPAPIFGKVVKSDGDDFVVLMKTAAKPEVGAEGIAAKWFLKAIGNWVDVAKVKVTKVAGKKLHLTIVEIVEDEYDSSTSYHFEKDSKVRFQLH